MVTNSTYLDAGNLFDNVFNHTSIFGETLILQAMVLIIVMILITRKPSKWGEVALPVLVGLRISGMHINMVIIIISTIIFVISILGMETVGTTLSAGGENIKNVFTYGGKIGRDKREYKAAIREKEKAGALEAYDKYNKEKALWGAKKDLGQIGISTKATFKQGVGTGKSYTGLAKEKTEQAKRLENEDYNTWLTRTLRADRKRNPNRMSTITDAVEHSKRNRSPYSPVQKYRIEQIIQENLPKRPKLFIKVTGDTKRETRAFIRQKKRRYYK